MPPILSEWATLNYSNFLCAGMLDSSLVDGALLLSIHSSRSLLLKKIIFAPGLENEIALLHVSLYRKDLEMFMYCAASLKLMISLLLKDCLRMKSFISAICCSNR